MDSNAILDFYRPHHSLDNFRNYGENSNNELIKICEIYDKTFIYSDVIIPYPGVNKIEFMDPKQK